MSKEDLKVGRQVSVSRKITKNDVESFAELSGDRNPIHFDADFAEKTIFQKPVAHGMIGASLISGALTELMGSGNVWLSLSLKFEKPVYIGDEIVCTLTIRDVNRRGMATIAVEIKNLADETVLSGHVESMRFL